MKSFQWINIFVRDILITFVIAYMNWVLEYKLWIGGMLMGMMIVLISWHFSDFMPQRKFIE